MSGFKVFGFRVKFSQIPIIKATEFGAATSWAQDCRLTQALEREADGKSE